MARNRTISPDFWTWEAVIDCKPMTRLLFIGLWNFADDGGVQPLRPRTIRMQVFPGDDVSADAVRAMIDELAAQGLVRLYELEGLEYVAIVDWEQLQRVGKRARRRYPPFPETVPSASEAHEALPAPTPTPPDHSKPLQNPASAFRLPNEEWRAAIGARLRECWPSGPPIEAMEPAGTERMIAQWIEGGCDLERDVLAAVSALGAPPAGLHALAIAVNVNRAHRLAAPASPMQAAA